METVAVETVAVETVPAAKRSRSARCDESAMRGSMFFVVDWESTKSVANGRGKRWWVLMQSVY